MTNPAGCFHNTQQQISEAGCRGTIYSSALRNRTSLTRTSGNQYQGYSRMWQVLLYRRFYLWWFELTALVMIHPAVSREAIDISFKTHG